MKVKRQKAKGRSSGALRAKNLLLIRSPKILIRSAKNLLLTFTLCLARSLPALPLLPFTFLLLPSV
jgi:hypothetical protein